MVTTFIFNLVTSPGYAKRKKGKIARKIREVRKAKKDVRNSALMKKTGGSKAESAFGDADLDGALNSTGGGGSYHGGDGCTGSGNINC